MPRSPCRPSERSRPRWAGIEPGYRGNSGHLTIRNQRNEVADHLKDNPSLQPSLAEAMVAAYHRAVGAAERETGLAETIFPASCPWTPDQVTLQRLSPRQLGPSRHHMRRRPLRRCLLIALQNRLQNSGVFVPEPLLPRRILRSEQHRRPFPQPVQHLSQHSVLSRCCQGLMELPVEIGKLPELPRRRRRRSSAEHTLYDLQGFRIPPTRRQPGIVALQQRPHLYRLPRLLFR